MCKLSHQALVLSDLNCCVFRLRIEERFRLQDDFSIVLAFIGLNRLNGFAAHQ